MEIWLLHERGRIGIEPSEIVEVVDDHPGYSVLAFDAEQAIAFGSLRAVRDPMDRMILSAARATGSRLVSADRALGEFVETLWD